MAESTDEKVQAAVERVRDYRFIDYRFFINTQNVGVRAGDVAAAPFPVPDCAHGDHGGYEGKGGIEMSEEYSKKEMNRDHVGMVKHE